MDIIELLKAAFFGLVEGITEWLPVSSTGHMLLVGEFVKLNTSKDFWDMFLVVIQLGAILAVCVMFFSDLNPFSRRKSADERRGTWSLWAKIIVACLPAAVIGLPLDDWIEDHLGSPFVIAAALIVYGVIFIVIETMRGKKAERVAAEKSHGSAPRHLAAPDAAAAGDVATVAELADADARVQDISELPSSPSTSPSPSWSARAACAS